MSPKSIQRQSGHAAILFALMIPVLFGVFALGTDGSRAVQDKARLLEAVEVASLAVAGEGSDDTALAKSYLQYYFPLAEINHDDITIKKINCEDNPACKGQDRRFFEYQVSARISQPTWFPGNDAIIGFGADYQVFDRSVTRKYHSTTVDVTFVADFSGSMTWTWGKDRGVRYEDLISIIKSVTEELNEFNKLHKDSERKNKASFTAFNYYVNGFNDNNKKCEITHLYFNNNALNVEKTIDEIFKKKSCRNTPRVYPSRFEDIAMTSDFDSFNTTISGFKPTTTSFLPATASYEGIINGAQLALTGNNPRNLIIILSDGVDNHPDYTKALVNKGLCEKIINKIENKEVDGKKVKARIALIGFAYKVDTNKSLSECVGGFNSGNVFQAYERNEIKNKILELITEEIGHLAPQR
ncbi:TadE/TadG family type IV pilus assembly protein [Vibrio metschnikovii]|uniref:TadE/TadG family type IV pilus assembly protein n=1 Tax=Vibrio metschnikovii TaxID=28172 RepID=UPI001C2FF2F9|nr:TadE/TadG family type IV pilus assembly protein [Vibrio metschnikovii]